MSSFVNAQQSTGIKEDTLTLMRDTIDKWLQPPDHDDVLQTSQQIGTLKAKIIRLKRTIKNAEDATNNSVEKPRSDEAKRMRANATAHLEDQLSELEAQLVEVEQRYTYFEYHLKMYQHAMYHSRMALKIDI